MFHIFARFFIIFSLLFSGCGVFDDDDSVQSTQITYDFTEVDPVIEDFMDEVDAVEGASLIIVHKDYGVIYEEAYGNHTLDTIVLIASTSKVPSAGILMSLVDDSLIDLEEPIANYVGWGMYHPTLTVAHLLSNTSGLPGLSSHGLPYFPHICQFDTSDLLSDCAEDIFQADTSSDDVPPGTVFQYGGGQWQIAGGVAEVVSGKAWWELVEERLVEPCDLSVFEYGNPYANPDAWDGTPESLEGQLNPSIEGGAISDLYDYGKILLMHLNDGMCGQERVLSEASVNEMRVDRGTAAGGPAYGFGWWISTPDDGSDPTVFYDPGLYGTVAWIDIERGYGGYLALETTSADGQELYSRIRPLIEAAIDEAE